MIKINDFVTTKEDIGLLYMLPYYGARVLSVYKASVNENYHIAMVCVDVAGAVSRFTKIDLEVYKAQPQKYEFVDDIESFLNKKVWYYFFCNLKKLEKTIIVFPNGTSKEDFLEPKLGSHYITDDGLAEVAEISQDRKTVWLEINR